MRALLAMLLLLTAAGWVSCAWDDDWRPNHPSFIAQKPWGWRRTADGWEKAQDWWPQAANTPPAQAGYIPPLGVALLQLGLSVGALAVLTQSKEKFSPKA